jgi:hypothetical protein
MNPNEKLFQELKRFQELVEEDQPPHNQKPVQHYMTQYLQAMKRNYPLQDSDRHALKSLQQVLHLKDEEVMEIERRLAKAARQTNETASNTGRISSPPNPNPPQLNRPQIQSKAAVAQDQLKVLKALESHSLTLKDLTYRTGLPLLTLQTIVQTLWSKGYIDRLSAPLLHWIFPILKPKRDRQQPIREDEFLSLTLTGYFHLHPLIRVERGS